jgi:hypothetical protein
MTPRRPEEGTTVVTLLKKPVFPIVNGISQVVHRSIIIFPPVLPTSSVPSLFCHCVFGFVFPPTHPGKSLEPYERFLHLYSCSKVIDGKGYRKMAIQERFQIESVGSDEILRVESDEEGFVNYEPGMLAQIEDDLNAERDRIFAEEFFCGWVS